MARQAPAGLLGIHINLPAIVPPDVAAVLAAGGPAPPGLSPKERETFEQLSATTKKGSRTYALMMASSPQTIGYAITDSPVGLAAWMLGHPGFSRWSYEHSDPEKSPDEVLNDITLYWLTNTATSSARLYWEARAIGSPAFSGPWKSSEISLPVAITVFPGEIYRAPETWARRAYPNLIYFREVDKGGHFAAWEQPAALCVGAAGRIQVTTLASEGAIDMKTNRIAAGVALIAASALALHTALAQQVGVRRTDLQRHDLSVAGREVIQTIVELEPGTTAPRHSHPGEEIIYVLEGTWEYTLEGQPPVIVKTGGVLFIPAGTIHSARIVGTARGAELATYIVEKGKPLVALAN